MDDATSWDNAKENVKPLRHGRSSSVLNEVLETESSVLMPKLKKERADFEREIANYDGDDPLAVWDQYITWSEQYFHSGGLKSQTHALIEKCIQSFKADEKYINDLRMVKIWLSYAQNVSDPLEVYEYMHNHKIGNCQAIFYYTWAEVLESLEDFVKAKLVLEEGIDCQAQPLVELERRQEDFFLRAARNVGKMMKEDEENEDHSPSRSTLGNLKKSGYTVKSAPTCRKTELKPAKGLSLLSVGKVGQGNKRTPAFQIHEEDEERHSRLRAQTGDWKSVPSRQAKKENTQEAGTWNKAKIKLGAPKAAAASFTVLEEESQTTDKETSNLFTSVGRPLRDISKVVSSTGVSDVTKEVTNEVFMFCKRRVCPGVEEFSFEELRAHKYKYEKLMYCKEIVNPRNAKEMSFEELRAERYFSHVFMFDLSIIKPCVDVEYQFEEIRAQRYKNKIQQQVEFEPNLSVNMEDDMPAPDISMQSPARVGNPNTTGSQTPLTLHSAQAMLVMHNLFSGTLSDEEKGNTNYVNKVVIPYQDETDVPVESTRCRPLRAILQSDALLDKENNPSQCMTRAGFSIAQENNPSQCMTKAGFSIAQENNPSQCMTKAGFSIAQENNPSQCMTKAGFSIAQENNPSQCMTRAGFSIAQENDPSQFMARVSSSISQDFVAARFRKQQENFDIDDVFDPKVCSTLRDVPGLDCMRKNIASVSLSPIGKSMTNHVIDTSNYIPFEDEDIFEQSIAIDVNNPFNEGMLKHFLQNLAVPLDNYSSYMGLHGVVPCFGKVGDRVSCPDILIHLSAKLGSGAHASVFDVLVERRGKQSKHALKVQRPAAMWEFYVANAVHERCVTQIKSQNVLPFMKIDLGMFFQDGSFLLSQIRPHGSLLNLVNSLSDRRVPEWLVAIIAIDMLWILELLQLAQIIHADVKPDNILFFGVPPLSDFAKEPASCIELIDFGQSIDLKMFPAGQTFTAKVQTDGFQCIEMKTNRPWNYQLDMFGMIGSLHVLLFGTYMNIYQTSGFWKSTKIPKRGFVFSRIWCKLFEQFLNIPSSMELPDICSLRRELSSELVSYFSSEDFSHSEYEFFSIKWPLPNA